MSVRSVAHQPEVAHVGLDVLDVDLEPLQLSFIDARFGELRVVVFHRVTVFKIQRDLRCFLNHFAQFLDLS